MKTIKMAGQVEQLQTALVKLVLLDDQAGPEGQELLLNIIARRRKPTPQAIEEVQAAAGCVLGLLSEARAILNTDGLSELVSGAAVVDEAIEQTEAWVARFCERPDKWLENAVHGIKRLWAGQRSLREVQSKIRSAIKRLRTRPLAGEQVITGGKPRELEKLEIYAEIQCLRSVLGNKGRKGTFESAVAEYNRSYGTNFSTAQVKQWGKRDRHRAVFEYGI